MTSPGALALRLGVRVLAMPDGATLRFHAPGVDQVQEITGGEVKASLRANFDAGEVGEEAETFWSPVIEGEAVTLEIELPASVDPDELEIALPRLSHLFQLPYGGTANEGTGIPEKAAASCHNDVMCYSAWDAPSRATARVIYTVGGNSYLCTGTLLNDTDTSTLIPYFLTGNHCISTQTAASSLQTYWFWRSTYCNSSVLGSYQTRTGGADLLYASATTDTSFLRLRDTPPGGAVFSGWSVALPAKGTALTGVHHPAGDLQKISLGALSDYWHCWDGTAGEFFCSPSTTGAADHFSLIWRSGITEPGSSGSGIYLNDTQQLVGTLHGGRSSCANPSDWDYYGRFDIPYQVALNQWLSSTPSYSLSVAKAGTGTGTVTSSPAGINCGSDCSESYAAGTNVTLTTSSVTGSTFTGWSGGCAGTGTCTLTMTAARSVTANFKFETFADVPPDSWAAAYIMAIYEAGITTGCGKGYYCPQNIVTREQMAAFLVRAVEGDPVADYCGGVPPFSDVSATAWSCGHIKRLVELGITLGCGPGKYCPNANVTREQMAAFIVRAVEGDPVANYCGGTSPFSDVSASTWSCGHIKRLVELGITLGCGGGKYCPFANVTREQMAAFLARAFLDME
jgi:rubredoxin